MPGGQKNGLEHERRNTGIRINGDSSVMVIDWVEFLGTEIRYIDFFMLLKN